MQRKATIAISVDVENLKRLSEDANLTALGRSGIVRLALREYYAKKDRQWRRLDGEKDSQAKHR